MIIVNFKCFFYGGKTGLNLSCIFHYRGGKKKVEEDENTKSRKKSLLNSQQYCFIYKASYHKQIHPHLYLFFFLTCHTASSPQLSILASKFIPKSLVQRSNRPNNTVLTGKYSDTLS